MADYQLIYWSVPFRGQFVRAVLAHAGKSWTETDDHEIGAMMEGPLSAMPVPFMGPPVLIDNATGFAIAEMPAIVLYLGDTLALLPDDPALRAMTLKIVADANDVIDEMTLQGGRDMWTEALWQERQPRVEKWMGIWEETGRRHGLTPDAGFLLGGSSAGIADVVSATLWGTMADRFSRVRELLERTAPMTAALVARVSALPSQAKLVDDTKARYGEDYAGGEIGASMAKVLNR